MNGSAFSVFCLSSFLIADVNEIKSSDLKIAYLALSSLKPPHAKCVPQTKRLCYNNR